MHAVARPARWPWALAGLVVAAVLAIPLGRLITTAGMPALQEHLTISAHPVASRTVTISAPVTQLSVQSYGAPILVTGSSGDDVQVAELLSGGAQMPAVQQSLSAGHLSLSDPACQNSGCRITFMIAVPSRVTVDATSGGGPLRVFGVAGAVLDSGGGAVQAGQISGPLTVTSKGGAVQLGGEPTAPVLPSVPSQPSVGQPSASQPSASQPSGAVQVSAAPIHITPAPAVSGPVTAVTGTLDVDTGGGPLVAQGVASNTVDATTSGGQAKIAFSAAPDKVTVSTGGGPAAVTVPGGPYAVRASSGSGPQRIGIATDPAASRSLAVSTAGGPLVIEPAGGH